MVSKCFFSEVRLGDYIFGLDPQLILDSADYHSRYVLSCFCFCPIYLFNPARNLLQKAGGKLKSRWKQLQRKRMTIQFKEEYDEKLKNVDKESEEILTETRKKALKKESDIIGEAREEAARVIDRANKEAELEKNKVRDEVKQEMIAVATAMAGKFIASSLDEGKQSQLIEDTLKEMGDETWLS